MNRKFLINEIKGDGYDRVAYLEEQESILKLWVHFIQFDEYVESFQGMTQNVKGDIIGGELKIDLVVKYEKNSSNKELGFDQPIVGSSHIFANGIVTQIEDECMIRCNINGLSTDIAIKFENDTAINIGDRIQLGGSLELEIK